MPKLIISRKAQVNDIKKAQQVINKLANNTIRPRVSNKFGYLTLECGVHCRLLSKDGGKHYELMSHSTYNRAIDC